ncbi:MAG: A/G-specific adenine glycosylase [Anaerolineae bacterium]
MPTNQPTHNPTSRDTAQLRRRLLSWYHANARNLPWRNETDPYRVWVSEVMLQQTQVVTVVPYYHRFLAQFPTVQALAAAPLDEVLKQWQGLGYYARARNMHRAAQKIVDAFAGQLPRSSAELRRLPGFGAYTAGAVASIAFGEVVPAIDGNVKRVLARLFALDGDPARGETARQLQQHAAALVDPAAPGDWNQAVMELGATVCLPRNPRCIDCSLRENCQAHAHGIEHTLPRKAARKPLPHYHVTAAVIRRDGLVLIAQRPPEGMLGGMWEFPGGKQEPGESLPQCLRREIREELGVEIEVGEPVTVVKHSYTHFKITLHAFACRLVSGTPQRLGVADWRWITPAQFDDFAFPRTDRQIIDALNGQNDAV